RNPKPETRNPKPETCNPKLETRNSKPETRNPKPETRNPNPETRNPKPETRNRNTPVLPPAQHPTPFLHPSWVTVTCLRNLAGVLGLAASHLSIHRACAVSWLNFIG
ncbi:hypothetical protein T484DRAFT_1634976, partial [Baffinella frigidus]